MKPTTPGLALIAGQAHAALEVCDGSFKELTAAILAGNHAAVSAAAERLCRQATAASFHASAIERLSRELRTDSRRVQ